MVDEIPNSPNMVFQLFGEREGFTNKARYSLAHCAIKAFNVIGFACFLTLSIAIVALAFWVVVMD